MKNRIIIPILLILNSCFSQNMDNKINKIIELSNNFKFSNIDCDSIRSLMHQLYFSNITQDDYNNFNDYIESIIEDTIVIYDGTNSCSHLKLIAKSVLSSFKYQDQSNFQKFRQINNDYSKIKKDKAITKILLLRISEDLDLASKTKLIDTIIKSENGKIAIEALVDGEKELRKRNYLQHFTLYISKKTGSPDYLNYLRQYCIKINTIDYGDFLNSGNEIYKLNIKELDLNVISEIQHDLMKFSDSNKEYK